MSNFHGPTIDDIEEREALLGFPRLERDDYVAYHTTLKYSILFIGMLEERQERIIENNIIPALGEFMNLAAYGTHYLETGDLDPSHEINRYYLASGVRHLLRV